MADFVDKTFNSLIEQVGHNGKPRITVIFNTIGPQVQVNLKDKPALLQEVEHRFAVGEGFALATINLDHLVKLRSLVHFANAYGQHDLIVADGNPIVWLSKIAGQKIDVVPGSDAVVPLAELAARAGVKVGLFGATQPSLEKAAEALRAKIPEIQIVSLIAPPMGFEPESEASDEYVRKLDNDGVGFVFLALGAPKQEIFAARARQVAPEIGFASVGAGLDFLSGTQVRAPKWAQAIAMEWAWRMFRSPFRLVPRYARCLAILPPLIRDALKQRSQNKA